MKCQILLVNNSAPREQLLAFLGNDNRAYEIVGRVFKGPFLPEGRVAVAAKWDGFDALTTVEPHELGETMSGLAFQALQTAHNIGVREDAIEISIATSRDFEQLADSVSTRQIQQTVALLHCEAPSSIH